MSEFINPVAGDIVVNSLGQYAKVIYVQKNGLYGISCWTNKINAEKANIVEKSVNKYGLKFAGVSIVDTSKKEVSKTNAPVEDTPTKSSLSKLNVGKTKELCEKLGLSTDGFKADMLERLYKHYSL